MRRIVCWISTNYFKSPINKKIIRFSCLYILLLVTCTFSSYTVDNELQDTDSIVICTRADKGRDFLVKQSIKPLNGIGNGPLYWYQNNRFHIDWQTAFQDLNIPIIRYHDVEFTNEKNNETVNVSKIFPDFHADASLPESYNFEATDSLLSAASRIGAKVIFRLGENIKNEWYFAGDNTPPADFKKWACVAERIIAHYENGWNNGYRYTNILWEVWNEPDNKSCWNGTIEQYCEFYKVICQHILSKHPNIDISPAYALHQDNRLKVYQCIHENDLRINHCFVHKYAHDFSSGQNLAKILKQELQHYGLNADLILDEWNFWSPNGDMKQTYNFIQSQQGAAWTAKQLIHLQSIDELKGAVYYSSDMPGFWTGLYKFDYNTKNIVLLPTYDVFKYFGELYRLGNEIVLKNLPKDIYALAACNENEIGIMVVNYSDKAKKISISSQYIPINKVIRVKNNIYEPQNGIIYLSLEPYDVSYISIK